jgi:hypothetical protein
MSKGLRWRTIWTFLFASAMAFENAHRYRHANVKKVETGVRKRARFCYTLHFDTLRLLLYFGLAGILLDVDHLFEGLRRTSHLPVTILCGIILCCVIALDYRRVHHDSVMVKDTE